MKFSSKIVLMIVILSIIVKVSGLSAPIYDDEANYAFSITNADSFGFNPHYYSPVLMQWIGILFTTLFGISTIVFRAIPLVISLFTLALVYKFAKDSYNKKTALLAVLLLCVSFYFTLASLQLDVEGSLVTFFVLASMYAYVKYEKTSQFLWQGITGACLGLALLSKHNAIIAFIVLGIYALIRTKNIKQTILNLFSPFAIAFSIYAVYLLLAYLINPNQLTFIFGHGAARVGVQLTLLSPMIFLFWATPLLIGLTILSFLKIRKQDYIFLVWIIATVLFNTFVISMGDFSRYYMHIIPAMAILGGAVISRMHFNRKQVLTGVIVGVVYYILLVLLNARPLKIIPRIMSYYVSQIKQLNFNFLFSYTSSSGPTFGVSFIVIALTICLSAALLFLIIIGKNTTKFVKLCLVIFLAINIAFNAVLIQEYVFHVQGPDTSQATSDLVDYFKQNNLSYPIYSNDEGVLFYLDSSYWSSIISDGLVESIPDNEFDVDISPVIERVKCEGGTILLLNWPYIPAESPVWQITSECRHINSFYSKDYEVGSIYVC